MTPPASGSGDFPISAKSLRDRCLTVTRDDFERQHPHPWLVLGLKEEGEEDISLHTLSDSGLGAQAGFGQRAMLSLRSEVLSFLPLRKRPGGKPADILTVGRSRDNDVIFKHPSVSKLHARFLFKAGEWWLADAGSLNGTFMSFRPVPSGDGLPLRDRAMLKFGSVSCSVLMRSGELYDSLVGRAGR